MSDKIIIKNINSILITKPSSELEKAVSEELLQERKVSLASLLASQPEGSGVSI